MAYKFREFKELAKGDGFDYPVDVYSQTIHLGVLVAKPDGYMIYLIKGPQGDVRIKESHKNKFKTKEIAAEILHHAWKNERIEQP